MPRQTRKQVVGKQVENNACREQARKLREFVQAFRREQLQTNSEAAR